MDFRSGRGKPSDFEWGGGGGETGNLKHKFWLFQRVNIRISSCGTSQARTWEDSHAHVWPEPGKFPFCCRSTFSRLGRLSDLFHRKWDWQDDPCHPKTLIFNHAAKFRHLTGSCRYFGAVAHQPTGFYYFHSGFIIFISFSGRFTFFSLS